MRGEVSRGQMARDLGVLSLLALTFLLLPCSASAKEELGKGDLSPDFAPWGIVMSGRNLADHDIFNKSVSSEVIKTWKKQVKKSAKMGVKEVEDEIVSDDPEFGRATATQKEVEDVISKARKLAVPAGDISKGETESTKAEQRAQSQAEASAFMAAQEAAIADAYDVPTITTINPYPTARASKPALPGLKRIVRPANPLQHRAMASQGTRTQKRAHSTPGTLPPKKAELEQVHAGGFGPQRLTELDQDSLGGGYDKSAKSLWDPVVQGAANEADTQALIHDVQHNFMAQGDPSGRAGKGYTGVDESGPVWHADWSASSGDSSWADSSSAPNTPSIAGTSTSQDASSVVSSSLQPEADSSVSSSIDSNSGPSGSGCKPEMIDTCRGECTSKENLELGDTDQTYNGCMQSCLGICSKGLGYGEGAAPDQNAVASAAEVANAAIKRLEEKANLKEGATPSVSLDPEKQDSPGPRPIPASAASTAAWHQSAGGVAAAAAAGPATGSRPLPVENTGKSGARTGVYDCRGQPIRVGSVVGRMVPGQPCEDRILLLTAGKWQVTDYKKPGAKELAQMGENKAGRVGVVLDGISLGVNLQHQVEIVPVRGSFVSWKIIQGPTDDLYMPANLQTLTSQGKANIAGTASGPQYVAALLGPSAARTASSGSSKVESIEAAKVSDWSSTGLTEKEDANLDMCPGPSCPQVGAEHKRKIMSLGDPIWKYVVCAILVGMFLALRYIRKAGGEEGAREQYVQLPDMFAKFDVVIGDPKKGKEGGARPCPGMKAGERIVMVENASDRVVMVDVAGQQGGGQAGQGNRDTASDDVGYQG